MSSSLVESLPNLAELQLCASGTCDSASNCYKFCIFPKKQKIASILCFRDTRFCKQLSQILQTSPHSPQNMPPPLKKNASILCFRDMRCCKQLSQFLHTPQETPEKKSRAFRASGTRDSASNCHKLCRLPRILPKNPPHTHPKKNREHFVLQGHWILQATVTNSPRNPQKKKRACCASGTSKAL